MSVEQIVEVPEKGLLNIQLPPSLSSKKVKVVVDEIDEDREAKVALLKKVATDKLFLEDMEEVSRDFDAIETKIEQ